MSSIVGVFHFGESERFYQVAARLSSASDLPRIREFA